VRGLEYDIHDDKIQQLNDFEVYHLNRIQNVKSNDEGNPSDFLLSNWLKILQDWSNRQGKEHAPITLFIELKNSPVDSNTKPDSLYGIEKLNQIITDSISLNKLYTYNNFREMDFKWPTVKELSGRLILVLMSYWGGTWASNEGGFESRLKYLSKSLNSKKGICFVSWVEEDPVDKSLMLKKKANFWKCSIENSTEKFIENVKSQRLTIVDLDEIDYNGDRCKHGKTHYEKNYYNGYRCNFPITDSWNSDEYDNAFPWSI
jgi:hypothetical protein